MDPGSWILDLQPIAPKKASIAKIQNPRSGADLHTGRQNCASSLRKRSLDEGLMSFLEIQCLPSGGPEPPQDHRSRLRGSKGAFRCWQGAKITRQDPRHPSLQSRNTSLSLKFQWGLPETHSQSGSQGSSGRSPLESNSLKSGEKSSGMFNYLRFQRPEILLDPMIVHEWGAPRCGLRAALSGARESPASYASATLPCRGLVTVWGF